MNKEGIKKLLLLLVIVLLVCDLCSTTENLCLCDGAQRPCDCRNRSPMDIQERIQSCNYPAHMSGVV
jgi:hypothetical protein